MIKVANRLNIMQGGVIAVPGNEPISAVTKVSNYQDNPYVETILNCDYCTNAYITLDKAIELIPDARVISSPDRSMRYFVLPKGPPPDGGECCYSMEDYYDILRKNADIGPEKKEKQPPTLDEICSGFSFDFCDRIK